MFLIGATHKMHESGHALEEVGSNTCIPAVLII